MKTKRENSVTSVGGVGRLKALIFALAIVGSCIGGGRANSQEPTEGTLTVVGAARDLDRLTLWRQDPGREAQPAAVRVIPGDQSDVVTVRHECRSGEYFVRTAALVSRPFRVDENRCGSPRDVVLFPAATLRGRVVAPQNVPAVPVIAVALRACADRTRGDDLGQYRLRAAADGLFSLPVPAGCRAAPPSSRRLGRRSSACLRPASSARSSSLMAGPRSEHS